MAYRTTIRSLCQMYVGDVSHQSVLGGSWSDHVGVEWLTAPQSDLCVIIVYVGDVSHQSDLGGSWSDHVGVEWPTAPQLDLCVRCMLVMYRTTVTSGCRISVGGVSYLPHLGVVAYRISHVLVSQESSGASHRSNILVSCACW